MYKTLLEALKIAPSDQPIKKEHFLFLLGTGVNYIDTPDKDKGYIRGETLSYAAQVISQLRIETPVKQEADAQKTNNPNYAHPYYSYSVDVINGADVAGSEVGQRIAKGLLLALIAIAKGKTQLNFSGFSRGGAEAIVLMHELQRIKKALEEDKDKDPKQSLADIIKNSKSVPTKNPTYYKCNSSL